MKLSLTLILLSLSLIYSTPLHLTTKQSAQIRGQELWCVAKNNAEDAALQSALDWACSSGGADCTAIQQGGPCYDPADIQRTASFAFNDYFLKHGLTEDSCNFDNAAALTSLNPSHANCKFPSSSTGKNGNFTGSSSVGTGPTFADINNSNSIDCLRFWVLIPVIHLISGLSF
ncbi:PLASMODESMATA CALLOSE-BINDING PROTEIN 5-like [Apium graveolens]|uniref:PLASMODESMATA CALLOSE-BINDING PROTEIN 5-like n=1 Tax=Apium graveolens TaxID=4045 RepID=UPI003D7A4844